MKWVGSVVPAPHGSRFRSSGGREKHYGAVELSEAGQQIYVNDVVEILPLKLEWDQEQQQQKQQPGNFPEMGQPRLAQVLSMWEDAFTGVFKFRGRWLVRSSEVPEETLSRLRGARRAFATRDRGSVGGARIRDLEDIGEVFLSHREDNLEMARVVRHVILSVPISKMTEILSEWNGKLGPRLTHAFDESTGDFFALESSHPILKRARFRQAELVAARSSRTLQDGEAAASNARGERAAERGPRCGGGWLLPKAKVFESTAKQGQGGSARPSSETLVERAHQESDMDVTPVDAIEEGNNEGDAARRIKDATIKQPKRKASELWPTRDGKRGVETLEDTVVEDISVTPTRTTLGVSTVHKAGGLITRTRRLAMPPARIDAGSEIVDKTPGIETPRRHVLPSTLSGTSVGEPDGRPPSIKMMSPPAGSSSDGTQSPSPSPKRTRKTVADKSDRSSRLTSVGDIFQAEIPSMIFNEKGDTSASSTGAELVWRSIRDWDESSRKSLSDYLHRAREIVQDSQAQVGVPVHVRLAGGIGDDSRESGNLNRAVDGSYAVWAITSSRDKDKVVRVACSEMAQTEVPRSGIQVVQFEEEALNALFKTAHVPGNYERALEMLADSRASPKTLEQWNLTQVRTLERVLEQEFDPSRHPHDWSPHRDVDREDFIDLARVSRQIPGKSPSQVLAFYYKYIAAAEPLTDIVYGPEAANARKNEPLFLADTNGATANAINAMEASAPSARPTREIRAENDRRFIRLYAPKPVQFVEAKQRRSDGDVPAKALAGEPQHLSRNVSPSNRAFIAMPAKGSRETFVRLDATQSPYASGFEATQYPAPRLVHGGMDAEQAAQRKATPPKTIPPDVEVLEIGDSDEDNRARRLGARNGEAPSESTEPRRENNSHCSALAPPGPSGEQAVDLSRPPASVRSPWVAGQMRWAPGLTRPVGGQHPFRTPRGQPNMVPMSTLGANPSSAPSNDPNGAPMGVRRERQHLPQPRPLQAPSGSLASAFHEGSSSFEPDATGRNRSMMSDSRTPTGIRPCNGNGNLRSLPTDRDSDGDEFGAMAPCWRLLERAKSYIDVDQLEYMRGLLLANAKKPMSRDQMLIRVESCLEGKNAIISSFMKMFDHIDQQTLVPLYSGKKGAPTASHSPVMSSVRPFLGSNVPQPGRSGPDPFGVSGYPPYLAGVGTVEAGSGRGSTRGTFNSNASLLHQVVPAAYAPADVRLRSAPPYGRNGREESNHVHHHSSASMLTVSQADSSVYTDHVHHLSQQPPPQWRGGSNNASMMDVQRNGWGQR